MWYNCVKVRLGGKVRKELILKEIDRMIFEDGEKISFRVLANNLNIAPSTISYQFINQDNLYKEYLKFKLLQVITPKAIQSFESLCLAIGEQIYIIFQKIADDISFATMDRLIGTVSLGNIQIIDNLFECDYGRIYRQQEVAIMSSIVMSMAFPTNYENILNINLSEPKLRERFIKNIIADQVRLIKFG